MGFLHSLAERLHVPQDARNRTMDAWRRLTRWKPPFYRRAVAFGLNTAPRDVKITVSLTSYPGRIGTISETIDTLLTQTLKPDRVVLWLGREKFPNGEADLPRRLLDQRALGLTIAWCRDQRSFTKLLPALAAYPDDILITVDDDIFYNPDLVERLYASYRAHPGDVSSQIVIRMRPAPGGAPGALASYNDWCFDGRAEAASFAYVLMGVSGVLYPPRALPDEVFNEAAFRDLTPTTDDLWFWAMAAKAGRRVRCVCGSRELFRAIPYADQSASLWSRNIDTRTGNDPQLARLLAAYPDVRARMVDDLAANAPCDGETA